MLDKARSETLNDHFQESLKELDRTIQKAQLIRRIEEKSRQSKNASDEELLQIMKDIMDIREQIRLLDQEES